MKSRAKIVVSVPKRRNKLAVLVRTRAGAGKHRDRKREARNTHFEASDAGSR